MKTLFICALALLFGISVPVLAFPIGVLMFGFAIITFVKNSDD